MAVGPQPPIGALVDDLLRRSAGRMLAALARTLGPAHLDLAEDVVQGALLRALEVWPYRGVPDDPEAWLFRVARNAALDHVRRSTTFRSKVAPGAEATPEKWIGALGAPDRIALQPLADDELTLMFLCCHPKLGEDARVALTLKTVCGFSVREIAAAFLTSGTTVAQRITRGKRALREAGVEFELPGPAELPQRLSSVLRVIYLLFNEGYSPHCGAKPVRAELCGEAIRLGSLLTVEPFGDVPEVHALLALMLLHASRLSARSAPGGPLLLGEQDRSQWNKQLIAAGLRHLDIASSGDLLSAYHLEAGIAACHAVAKGEQDTDWERILHLYDLLVELKPTPVARLNRAVAVGMVEDAEAGLRELAPLEKEGELVGYHLLPAARAAFLELAGDRLGAKTAYLQALEWAGDSPDRTVLEHKLAECAAAS